MSKILIVLLVLFTNITISAQTKPIDASKSKIAWIGKKVTGEHVGTIDLKEGTLVFKNKKVVGGSFVADMTTLNNTDQTGQSKEKLEGHLRSTDFFNVENYKTAKLEFKTITAKKDNFYTIIADLTIKGITKSVTFSMLVKGKSAKAKLIIDRTRFGIQYDSGSYFEDLGDRTIYDDFELNVNLKF